MTALFRGRSGHTLIEMVVTIAVMGILASVALPMAAVTRKREKEIELRRALREIRSALDMYNVLCKSSLGGGIPGGGNATNAQGVQPLMLKIEDDPNQLCWPKELELLVEGVEVTNVPRYKLKFLRRIPRDPFNDPDEEHDGFGWEFRSTSDDPEDEGGWDRTNVFDVRSASKSQALDGSYYKDW
jgi:general secretion pathway protein G